MIHISQPKIKGLIPEWANFKGITLLLDNPDPIKNLKRIEGNVYQTHLAKEASGIAFYQALDETFASLNPLDLTHQYLFCPLPYPSYHVTLLDVANQGSPENILEKDRLAFTDFLNDLPESLHLASSFTRFEENPLSKKLSAPIELEFQKLTSWGGKVLAIKLKPTESSQTSFQQLLETRTRLINEYFPQFQKLPATTERIWNFEPHVTLGYFANQEGGKLAGSNLEEWNLLFGEKLKGLSLVFDSFSLYGFFSMAAFFKSNKEL